MLSAEAVDSLAVFDTQLEELSTVERLHRFCHLCQLIETYCLFDTIYVDSEDQCLLEGVVDIFRHPKIDLAGHPYLALGAATDLLPQDLNEQYGQGFVDDLVEDFIAQFPEGLSNHGQVFRAIKGHDLPLVTALAANSGRDLLRSRILDIGLGKVFLRVCGDAIELPDGASRDSLFAAREFCDNRLWEGHLNMLFLPSYGDYLTQFEPGSEEARSLDAGRMIRKAYAILLESLRSSLDFEDELAVSENFIVPPVTSAVLQEIRSSKTGQFAALVESIYIWRRKFGDFRNLLREFYLTRRERPKGYRKKLVKLKKQMEKSSSALIAKFGAGYRTKLEFLNFDKLADVDLGVEDLKLSNIVGAGLDKARQLYDLSIVKPLPELGAIILEINDEGSAICQLCQFSEGEFQELLGHLSVEMLALNRQLVDTFASGQSRPSESGLE